jgi:hypothetical protein
LVGRRSPRRTAAANLRVSAGEAQIARAWGERSMPMQFVRVEYPTRRLVYVDGEKCGYTNKVLRIGQGTHLFDLGPLTNYTPRSREADVVGTTAQTPLELKFRPKPTA